MAGLLGMPTWTVTTTATALAGFPDTAYGVSPFIFSADAFGNDGTPHVPDPDGLRRDQRRCRRRAAWTSPGPTTARATWTRPRCREIISGDLVIDKELTFGEYIGQHNSGNHTALFDDVNTYLAGLDVPAAVVDSNGNFAGWATFHVISADGGAAKPISGYFLTAFESARLSVTACAANNCPRYLGSYVLKLSN